MPVCGLSSQVRIGQMNDGARLDDRKECNMVFVSNQTLVHEEAQREWQKTYQALKAIFSDEVLWTYDVEKKCVISDQW